MKTKIDLRKHRFTQLTKVFMTGALLSIGINAKAQTGTYTVLQQPCNNDGQLSVTITAGLIPPLNFIYYDSHGLSYTHTSVASLTDILSGIPNPITYIYVTETASPGLVYYNTPVAGMIAPFIIDPPITTDAICPSLTGTAQLTINGGSAPASVQWFDYSSGSFAGTGNPIALSPAKLRQVGLRRDQGQRGLCRLLAAAFR